MKPKKIEPSGVETFLVAGLVASLANMMLHIPSPLARLMTGLGRVLSSIFLTISPTVPVDLAECVRTENTKRLVGSAFVAGLVFSLVGTACFSWIDGTLWGTDSNRMYFSEDVWNIALYLFVTPTYVALGTWLVVLTVRHWKEVADFATEVSGTRSDQSRRLGRTIAIGVGLASVSTANYMHDIMDMDQAHVPDLYWFMTLSKDGARILNRTGYYYVALNFVLLFVALISAAAFFSLTVEVFRSGKGIQQGNVKDLSIVRNRLEAFTTAYLVIKLLAATYMVNMFIWKDSPLDSTINLTIAGLVLTMIGVFFIAIPRLFVELKWFEYAATQERLVSEEGEVSTEIRPKKVRVWAHVLDVFIIGSFVASFWDLSPMVLLEALKP